MSKHSGESRKSIRHGIVDCHSEFDRRPHQEMMDKGEMMMGKGKMPMKKSSMSKSTSKGSKY